MIARFAGTPERSRGIALVAVLWIVTTLTVLVLSFNASVRSHLDVSVSELSIAHADAAIEAAVRLAVFKLREPEKRGRWTSDGQPYTAEVVGRTVRIAILNHKGLVDLNGAAPELLAALLDKHLADPGQSRQLTARIIAWRDGGRAFADPIELAEVPGFSAAIVDRLAPYVTIYGGGAPPRKAPKSQSAADEAASTVAAAEARSEVRSAVRGDARGGSRINVVTAPPGVLQLLPGITAGTVSQILALRAQSGIDKQAMLVPLARWQHLVEARDPGPAYQLRIDVTDASLVPSAAIVSVLLPSDSKQPFHVLDWRSARPLRR